jgi:ubiquinone/menaquinone biosynthesis C-methylase UbiE
MTTKEQWQLSDDAAELYERYVARYILAPWAPGLIDLAHVGRGERVLDLACGTGVVARRAAERAGPTGSITGVDLNPGMLAVARSLPAPPGARVEWIERNAVDTGLPAGSFDVVLCQQGLQFFPDKAAALREVWRVLVPGGRTAISVWRTAGIYNRAVGDALRQLFGEALATRFCASRVAPPGHALLDAARAAGFDAATLSVQKLTSRLPPPEEFVLEHLAATPIAPELRAVDSQVRKALAEHVARGLAAYRDTDGIAFPEEVNVVTGRKGAQ